MTQIKRVLIAGAGLTGASAASYLPKYLKPQSLSLVEGKGFVGGRYKGDHATFTKAGSPLLHFDGDVQHLRFASGSSSKHTQFFDPLVKAGLLVPLPGNVEGALSEDDILYQLPHGYSALIKHIINDAGAKLYLNEEIKSVDIQDRAIQLSMHNTTSNKTYSVGCNALILTMPVNNVLNLEGSIRNILDSQPEVKQKLEKASYHVKIVAYLHFSQNIDLPWSGKYFPMNPFLSSVCKHSVKEAAKARGILLSLAAKSSFSDHYKSMPKNKLGLFLTQKLQEAEPYIPMPDSIRTVCYDPAEVQKCYPGSTGCVVLNENPPVILAGDAFTSSTLDGCIESGKAAVAALAGLIQQSGLVSEHRTTAAENLAEKAVELLEKSPISQTDTAKFNTRDSKQSDESLSGYNRHKVTDLEKQMKSLKEEMKQLKNETHVIKKLYVRLTKKMEEIESEQTEQVKKKKDE